MKEYTSKFLAKTFGEQCIEVMENENITDRVQISNRVQDIRVLLKRQALHKRAELNNKDYQSRNGFGYHTH